jgi:hypothetical protein
MHTYTHTHIHTFTHEHIRTFTNAYIQFEMPKGHHSFHEEGYRIEAMTQPMGGGISKSRSVPILCV